MSSLFSSKFVPDEGPEDADIMCVGEAPGQMEDKIGRPFVSHSVAREAGIHLRYRTAGSFLEKYLKRVGKERDEVYLTNLGHYRPRKNVFPLYFKDPDLLSEQLEILGETINRVNPNIIFALGNWPMWFLTGATSEKGGKGTGIMSWRGSIIPAIDEHIPGIADRKVLVTFHPSFVMRPQGFGWHPIFMNDLSLGVEDSHTDAFTYPEYEELIDPTNVWDIAEEMAEAEWLSVDIETFGPQLACCGFADSIHRGLCLTHENSQSWEVTRFLLRSPAKKIFQFGAFDINYLWHYYGWEVENYAFDTYIAAANLMPEFKRGLDFLTSIYTRFPFYKEERKKWKATGDLTTLWQYNIKDIIATMIIAQKQMPEIEKLYQHTSMGVT